MEEAHAGIDGGASPPATRSLSKKQIKQQHQQQARSPKKALGTGSTPTTQQSQDGVAPYGLNQQSIQLQMQMLL